MAATRMKTDSDSIVVASVWMTGLAIALGWIPVIGPAIAGFVGGRKAGSPSRGVLAGIIPAVMVGVLVGLLLAAFDLPLIGTVTGVALTVWIAIETIPLLIAAALGGWADETQTGSPA